jgi:FkbM family methyltransferase
MTNKKFYQQSVKGRGTLLSLPRRIHYYIARPFYQYLVRLVEAQESSIAKNQLKLNQKLDRHTKDLAAQKEKLRCAISDHEARHMDFDAILHRLGFVEEKLRLSDSRIAEIGNAVGPMAKLTLGERTSELVLPGPALTINHGRYGDFILRTPDVVGDYIRSGGFWDEHLHDLIIRHSDPDGVAVDAGAYVGFHSCFLARYFGKVVSFEPQPLIFRMLATNLLLNGHENVDLHNTALYDRECVMRVAEQDKQEITVVLKDQQVDYSALPNAGALTFEVSESGPGAVQAYPLDAMNLEKVKFIKIDTQGSDLKVLLGAKQTIRRCRPVIVFEYEQQLSQSHQSPRAEYERFFEEMGYELVLLRSQEDKQFDFCALPR